MRAIVLSSGASMTLTKSKEPSVRPLRLDLGAELLDLLVDLADALRDVANGLDPFRRERREHDVGRHGVLLAGSSPFPFYEASRPMRCSLTMLLRTTFLAAAFAALSATPASAPPRRQARATWPPRRPSASS